MRRAVCELQPRAGFTLIELIATDSHRCHTTPATFEPLLATRRFMREIGL